jgi:hypothetical protein
LENTLFYAFNQVLVPVEAEPCWCLCAERRLRKDLGFFVLATVGQGGKALSQVQVAVNMKAK